MSYRNIMEALDPDRMKLDSLRRDQLVLEPLDFRVSRTAPWTPNTSFSFAAKWKISDVFELEAVVVATTNHPSTDRRPDLIRPVRLEWETRYFKSSDDSVVFRTVDWPGPVLEEIIDRRDGRVGPLGAQLAAAHAEAATAPAAQYLVKLAELYRDGTLLDPASLVTLVHEECSESAVLLWDGSVAGVIHE